MPRLSRYFTALIFTTLAIGPAVAQDKTSADQISGPQRPGAFNAQLNVASQVAGSAGVSAQQIGADRGDPTRVTAVPPGAADACDAHLSGRGPAPASVDCSEVQAATARRTASASVEPTTIAESGLSAGPARREANALPDAQDVARRLATGDLNASAIAQTLGSGFGAPPVVADPKAPTVNSSRGVPTITVSRP